MNGWFAMWSRYKCPNCKADLKDDSPKPTKYPWYKLVSRYTLKCPSCEATLEKRFADFDIGMVTISTCGGAASIWGAGKIILLTIAILFVIRFIVGRLLSVYVLSKTDT